MTLDGVVTEGVVKNLTTPVDVAFAPGRHDVRAPVRGPVRSSAAALRAFGGEVRRVNADGTTSAVVSGLMFPTAMTFGPDGALYVTNYGNESNDGQGQILRVVIGDAAGDGAGRVRAPDESKSYALAQPTPVGQAAATAEIAGTVSMVEPDDPTQWGFDPQDPDRPGWPGGQVHQHGQGRAHRHRRARAPSTPGF